MRICAMCGKRPVVGSQVTHRGMLKKKGGVGRRTVRVNLRRFYPNVHRMTVVLNGSVRRVRVCTSCLKSDRVQRAPLKPSRRSPTAPASQPA